MKNKAPTTQAERDSIAATNAMLARAADARARVAKALDLME